ncbi:hypothetical protein [Pallidibacillus pasinlerensis]|uniref:PsbP C-terminal domain-containing protein n=1 Tax=Pallidibacillus pasinlerensis TaxID=2703818 RepID=A0ABX0A816_9BACI|nr:hypothetical protein [Pallidibacillus pasinlerensis]NCU18962.1 hypothetical protein [Pallidibacillus pasinlerensis]
MKLKYLLSSIVIGILLLAGCSNDDGSRKNPKEDSKIEEENDKNSDGGLFGNKDDTGDNDDLEEYLDKDNNDELNDNDEQGTTEDEDLDEEPVEEGSNDYAEIDEYSFIVADDGDYYIVKVGDIIFSYPNTFSATAMEQQLIPTFDITNADQTIVMNVAVEQLPLNVSPEEYLSIASTNYGIEYEEFSTKTNANGIEFAEGITEESGFQVNQRVVIVNGVAYVFSFASASYEENLGVFDQLIDTIDTK